MELKAYWPRYLQDVVEFDQIARAEQPEFQKAVQDVRSAPDDFFLVSLSDYGCKRWEAILGLSVAPGDTLEERRERILIRYLDQLPYTYRALLKYLSTVSEDFMVRLDNDAYELFVRIVLNGYTQRDALIAVLGQMIPANLVLLTQTAIPQGVARPACVVGAATVTMTRHEHQPEGGKENGKI